MSSVIAMALVTDAIGSAMVGQLVTLSLITSRICKLQHVKFVAGIIQQKGLGLVRELSSTRS